MASPPKGTWFSSPSTRKALAGCQRQPFRTSNEARNGKLQTRTTFPLNRISQFPPLAPLPPPLSAATCNDFKKLQQCGKIGRKGQLPTGSAGCLCFDSDVSCIFFLDWQSWRSSALYFAQAGSMVTLSCTSCELSRVCSASLKKVCTSLRKNAPI